MWGKRFVLLVVFGYSRLLWVEFHPGGTEDTMNKLARSVRRTGATVAGQLSPGGQSVPLAGASKCTTQGRAVNVDDPSEPQQGTLPAASPRAGVASRRR
jgi:hypothetical protein